MAVLQAYAMVAIAGAWLWAFAQFWTFMVIELPKDLGPYSQMSSLSMFMHRAFPMRETNDIEFEYKFEHVLMLANVMLVLMMGWMPTRYELREKAEKLKKAAGKGKKK
eukprot:CAMPEP_0115247854 /NCGR_PEP_ID=MMETSP0270-20121206/41768_1 /TAXON_ID=71861 /ORGANISM="Scrippsiella trochoidea, Strain CCMP3099" /LENGTH=107 /DNA_ID=CAMNT_0002663135 /DNA_START=186 /DNA_END=509 /DNA_ORIENTATION=-